MDLQRTSTSVAVVKPASDGDKGAIVQLSEREALTMTYGRPEERILLPLERAYTADDMDWVYGVVRA